MIEDEDSKEPSLSEGTYTARLDMVDYVSKDNSVELYFRVYDHPDCVVHRRIDTNTQNGVSELIDTIYFLKRRCEDITISRKVKVDVVYEERRCPFYDKSIWVNKVTNNPFRGW